MSIVLIRSVILYFLIIFAVRLMGKRQLGELQPSELVITILVSNIATLTLEDETIPLIVGITPIFVLVCFEVIVSWLSLKMPKLRRAISGQPKVIISNGIIDSHVMRELRFSVDDLVTALRSAGIFDISEVQFAIVETTGSVSVMRKKGSDTVCRDDILPKSESINPPHVIIADGKISEAAMKAVGLSHKNLSRTLSREKLHHENVLIMTADECGNYFISDKSGEKSITGCIGGENLT